MQPERVYLLELIEKAAAREDFQATPLSAILVHAAWKSDADLVSASDEDLIAGLEQMLRPAATEIPS